MNRQLKKVVIFVSFTFSTRAVQGSEKIYKYQSSVSELSEVREPLKPHKIEITNEILSLSSGNLNRIRILRSDLSEVPYAIKEDLPKDQEPSKTYELVINKFAKKNQQWEFIVSMPGANIEHLNRLHFDIKGENFVKEAIISCLNESIESRIVVGEIFDFAAETNIRKTHIDLPDIECQRFKIVLSDVERKLPSSGLSIQIDSKIANIKVNDRSLDNFKIDRIKAITNPKTTHRESFKSTTAIHFNAIADEKGFQVVELNPFYGSNIDLQFEVGNNYFYRNVIAYWIMNQTQDSEAGSGTIYRIPNTTQSELRLQIGSRPKDARGLRVKIEKGSNPELVLNSITSTGPKTFLYLIPESTDKLSISIGSPKLPFPTYETDRILKNYADVAQEATSLKTDSWSSKEISETIQNPHDKNEKTKNIFLIIIGFVVIISVIWIVSIIKKIKTT